MTESVLRSVANSSQRMKLAEFPQEYMIIIVHEIQTTVNQCFSFKRAVVEHANILNQLNLSLYSHWERQNWLCDNTKPCFSRLQGYLSEV